MAQETATLGVFAEWLCSAIETVLSSRLSAPSSSPMSSASAVFEPPLLHSSSSNPPVAAHGFFPTSSVRTTASSAPPLFGIPCSPRIPSLRNALFAAAPQLQSFPSCPPFSISVDLLLFLPFSTVGTCGLLPEVLPLLMPFSGEPLTLASTSNAPPTDRSPLSRTTSSVSRSSGGVALLRKTHEATQAEGGHGSGGNGELNSDFMRNFQHNDYQSRDTFRDDKTREGSRREANVGKSEREDEDGSETDSRERRDATIRPALFYSTREPHGTVDGECTTQKADMRDRQHRDGEDHLPSGVSPPVYVSPFFFSCHASHGRKREDESAGRSRGSDGGSGLPLTPSTSSFGFSRLGDERSVTTASSRSHHDNANDHLICLLLERWTFAYSPPLECASPPSWSPSGPSAALGGQSFDILLRNLSTAMRGFTAFAHLLPTFSLLSSAESLLFPQETDAGFNALSVPSMHMYPVRHQTPIYRYPKTQLQADENPRAAFHREDREAAQKSPLTSTSRIPSASSTYQRSLHPFSHHVPIPKASLSTAFLAAAPSLSSSPPKTSMAEPRRHRHASIPALSLPATSRSTSHSFLSSTCHPSHTNQRLRPCSATSSLSSSSPRRPFGPAELSACDREATSPSLASTASQTSFSGSLASSCLHGVRCSRSPRNPSGPAPPWCMHASIFLHWDGTPSSYRRRQSSRSSDVAVATYASHARPLSCHQPSLASSSASARSSEGTTWEGFSESQMSPLETSLSSLSGGPRIVAALVPRCASPRDSLRQPQGEKSTRGQKSGKREADASFRKPHSHRSDKHKKAVEKSSSKSLSACCSGSTQQTPRDVVGVGLGSAGAWDAGKKTWLSEEEAGYSQVPGVALPCGQGILSVRVAFREDIAFLLEPAAEACAGPGLVASSPDSSFGGSGRPEAQERRTSVVDREADETERLGRCAPPISSPTLSASGASGDFGGRPLFLVFQEGEGDRNMEKIAGRLADTGRKGNECQGERDSQGERQEAEGRMETDPSLKGEFHRGTEEEDQRTCFLPPHETISKPRTNVSDGKSPDSTRDLSAGASFFDSTPPPPVSVPASLPRKESTIHLSSSCTVAAGALRREVGDVSTSSAEIFRNSKDACTLDTFRLPRAAARHSGAAPCHFSIHLPFPGSTPYPSISPSSSVASLSPSASASGAPLQSAPEARKGEEEKRKGDERDEATPGDEDDGTQRVQVTDSSQQARSVYVNTNDEKGMEEHTHEEDNQTHAMKWVEPVFISWPLVPRDASWPVRASEVDSPGASLFSVPSACSEARRSSPYIWKGKSEGERGGKKGRGRGFEGSITTRERRVATDVETEGRKDTLEEGSSFVVANFASCRTMVRPSSSLVSSSPSFVHSDSCPPSGGALIFSQNSAAESKTRWAVLLQRSPALEPCRAVSAEPSSSPLPSSSPFLSSSLCRSSASTSLSSMSLFLPSSSPFLASSSSSPFVASASPFCSSSSTFLSTSRFLSSSPFRSPSSPALSSCPASTSASHCTEFGVAKLPAELRLSTEGLNLDAGVYSAKKEEGKNNTFPGCSKDTRKLEAQGQEEHAFWGGDKEARGAGTLERLRTHEIHRTVIVLDFDLEEESDGDQDFWEAGADVVPVGEQRADGELHVHPLLIDLTEDVSVESNALRASVERRRSSPKKRGSVHGFPFDVTARGGPFEMTPSREKALSCPTGVAACLTDKSDDGDDGDSSFLALWLMPELSAPSYAASQRLRAETTFAEAGEIKGEGGSEERQVEVVTGEPVPHPFTRLPSIKEVDDPLASSDLQVSSQCLSSAATPFSISGFLEEAANPPLGWLADAWQETLEAFRLSASEPVSLCNLFFPLVDDRTSPPSRHLTQDDELHSPSFCVSPSGPCEIPKAPKLRGSPHSLPSAPDSDDAFFSPAICCSLRAESTSSRLKTPSFASWRRNSSGSSREDQRKRAASSHQRPSQRQTAGEQEWAELQVVGKASTTSAETKRAGEAEKRKLCEGSGTKAIESDEISKEEAGERKCPSREGQKKSGKGSLLLVSQLVDLLHAADEASEADVSTCSSLALLSSAARPSPPSLAPTLSLSHVSSALLSPSFGTQRTGAGDASVREGKQVLDTPFFHGVAQRRHEGETETSGGKPDEVMKRHRHETPIKRGEKTSEAREEKGDRIKCDSNLGTGANVGGRRTSEKAWIVHQVRRLDKQLNAFAEFSRENQRRIAFPPAF